MVKNRELRTSQQLTQDKLKDAFTDMDKINLVLRGNNAKMEEMKGKVLDANLEKEKSQRNYKISNLNIVNLNTTLLK